VQHLRRCASAPLPHHKWTRTHLDGLMLVHREVRQCDVG
jgi:hypothetical protein